MTDTKSAVKTDASTDLVERYVHQVGRFLPKTDRADIEAELRSLIRDQLEDRYAGSPTPEEVAAVLTELGDPRKMAASYHHAQYLIGPDLYPYLVATLRHIWAIVPALSIFLSLFSIIVTPRSETWTQVLVEMLVGALVAGFNFSAVAVLGFAFFERVYAQVGKPESTFDPKALPRVNDPGAIDRFEVIFGIVIGTIWVLAFAYFLSVGGLTLRFDRRDPADVIAVPAVWLALTIGVTLAMIGMAALVLRLKRWNVTLWSVETLLELIGMICLYFVLYKPILARVLEANPSLADIQGVTSIPEVLVILMAGMTLIGRGSKLITLMGYRASTAN